jgi:hypothetical protein
MITHIRHFRKTHQLGTAIFALFMLFVSAAFVVFSVPVIMQQDILAMKAVAGVIFFCEAACMFLLARYEYFKLSWKTF